MREIYYDFQIIVINKKLNVEEYIQKYFLYNKSHDNRDNVKLYSLYIEDLKDTLEKSNMYESSIYMVIKEDKSNDAERILSKLDNLEIKIQKITDDIEVKKILYHMINKKY